MPVALDADGVTLFATEIFNVARIKMARFEVAVRSHVSIPPRRPMDRGIGSGSVGVRLRFGVRRRRTSGYSSVFAADVAAATAAASAAVRTVLRGGR